MGTVEIAQMFSLGQWKAEDPRFGPFKSWALIDAGSTHFYKTRFVLHWLGKLEIAQTVSLGQWKAEDPGPNPVDVRIFFPTFFDIYWVQSSF